MSKHTLIKRRKKQDAQWRRLAFYPQRMRVPSDRLWSVPEERPPYSGPGSRLYDPVLAARVAERHRNPYRKNR